MPVSNPSQLTAPLARPAGFELSLIAAAVIGLLLSTICVFMSFLVFNFILHRGA